MATAARVEQPGRGEEQKQSQDSRGQEGSDDTSHALLQGKVSPALCSPSTPKSSLPTPTWRESAPSLAVGSARLGGKEDEAAGGGFGDFGAPQEGGGFGLVAGVGFVAPASAVSSGRPYSSTRRSPEKKVRGGRTGRRCVIVSGLAACLRTMLTIRECMCDPERCLGAKHDTLSPSGRVACRHCHGRALAEHAGEAPAARAFAAAAFPSPRPLPSSMEHERCAHIALLQRTKQETQVACTPTVASSSLASSRLQQA